MQCTIYNSNASIRLEIHNIVKKVKQIQSLEVYELPNFELLEIWQQFTAMLYGQLSGQTGLQGIESGLQATEKKNYHLGMQPIKCLTLAYANSNRNNEIYQQLFYSMGDNLLRMKRAHKLGLKNPLHSVDATTIDLCFSTFDWIHFRKVRGGIKVHVKLDYRGYLLKFFSVYLRDFKV